MLQIDLFTDDALERWDRNFLSPPLNAVVESNRRQSDLHNKLAVLLPLTYENAHERLLIHWCYCQICTNDAGKRCRNMFWVNFNRLTSCSTTIIDVFSQWRMWNTISLFNSGKNKTLRMSTDFDPTSTSTYRGKVQPEILKFTSNKFLINFFWTRYVVMGAVRFDGEFTI